MRKIFLSLSVIVFFMAVSVSLAAGILNVEVETGAMKDQEKAVTKSAKDIVAIADPLDAKFLFSGEPASSLRFYKESDDTFSIITGIGDDAVEMPIYFFTPGNYIVVDTAESSGCAMFTLDECRTQSGFLSEAVFLVP